MRSLILVGGMLMALAIHAQAEPNFTSLANFICDEYETRGYLLPDDEIGFDREVGRCQIKIESARVVGFKGTRRDLMQKGGALSRVVAEKILRRCARVLNTSSVHRIAYCYNAGLARSYWPKFVSWGYANDVDRAYQYRMAKNPIRLAKR